MSAPQLSEAQQRVLLGTVRDGHLRERDWGPDAWLVRIGDWDGRTLDALEARGMVRFVKRDGRTRCELTGAGRKLGEAMYRAEEIDSMRRQTLVRMRDLLELDPDADLHELADEARA